MLEASFGEFAQHSPALYDTLIAERDQYMAARLRETAGDSRELLAVVGAGHLKGLARHLREDTEAPAAIVERLQALPEKSSIPWFTIALTLFVLGGFAWGFWHGGADVRSEEHTSELQSLMRISYAVFCLKKKNKHITIQKQEQTYD